MLVTVAAHPRIIFVLFASAILILGGLLAWSAPLKQSVLAGLQEALEKRFPRTTLDPTYDITGIISLGGEVARVREAARIATLYPRAQVVLSGPGEKENNFMRSLGFEPERYVIEAEATNTFENALFTKRLVNPKPGERWVVVTSAIHMPRAMGVFFALGFPVEAWPVFDAASRKHSLASAVRHEWLGLIAYRLFGYTRSFFPGPHENKSLRSETSNGGKAHSLGAA